MENVKLGIIGCGVIGIFHAKYLMANEVSGARLTAVCDVSSSNLDKFKTLFGNGVKQYTDYNKMLNSKEVDAVIIATPHYHHPSITTDSFHAGLHVMVEKPAGVFCKNVIEMNEAAKKSGKVFSIMYVKRAEPYFIKIKDLITSGELGEIKRINWTVTDWYRPQSYHDSNPWRSSWKGEGGGVLINQCPHDIDLWQWLFGMPSEITAFADFGKYYDIEVEDEVTAYMRYPNGVTGVFIASTGETPGTNRLEIAGDMGKITFENNRLTFNRNRVGERAFNETNNLALARPESWECIIPVDDRPKGHKQITQNFINAIIHGEPLIVPGEEGLNQLIISNAMHMSAWTGQTVKLPIDHEAYLRLLQEKINKSKV